VGGSTADSHFRQNPQFIVIPAEAGIQDKPNENVRRKFLDSRWKNLCLVRDFSRKRWPLRSSLQMTLINPPPLTKGEVGGFPRSQIPPHPPFLKWGIIGSKIYRQFFVDVDSLWIPVFTGMTPRLLSCHSCGSRPAPHLMRGIQDKPNENDLP
jgi:hypothetical protein